MRKNNVLTQSRYYELCTWLSKRADHLRQTNVRREDIAHAATIELGYRVTGYNIEAACKTVGLDLAASGGPTQVRQSRQVLAAAMLHIASELGVTLPNQSLLQAYAEARNVSEHDAAARP